MAERLSREALCWACSFWLGLSAEIVIDGGAYLVTADREVWAVGPEVEGGGVLFPRVRVRETEAAARRVAWAAFVGILPEVWALRLFGPAP